MSRGHGAKHGNLIFSGWASYNQLAPLPELAHHRGILLVAMEVAFLPPTKCPPSMLYDRVKDAFERPCGLHREIHLAYIPVSQKRRWVFRRTQMFGHWFALLRVIPVHLMGTSWSYSSSWFVLSLAVWSLLSDWHASNFILFFNWICLAVGYYVKNVFKNMLQSFYCTSWDQVALMPEKGGLSNLIWVPEVSRKQVVLLVNINHCMLG